MNGQARTASAILVIGWGSDLLGDDAAGRCVAREVAARNMPDVEALDVHQLTPELALYIAKARNVIFVDADANAEQDAIRMERVLSAHTADRAAPGHTGRPEDLLAMAESLYGMRPEAWLIAVPARSFEPREALSSVTRAGIRDAVSAIKELIGCDSRKRVKSRVMSSEVETSPACSMRRRFLDKLGMTIARFPRLHPTHTKPV